MPGAPNRPPEIEPAVPLADPTARRVLRRLAPARVALRLDLWKGAPSAELVTPLERAEATFSAGDLVTALSHLDQLSVRFAEPRWPTLPAPFKGLAVEIPAPMPPSWNPDNALAPADRELRRLQKEAELHRELVRATIEWGGRHSIPLEDLTPRLEAAVAVLASAGPTDAFWTEIDAIWQTVRDRVPMPQAVVRRTSPTPAA